MEEGPDNPSESREKEADQSKLELSKKTVRTKVKLAINLPWLLKAYVSRTWFQELRAKRLTKKPPNSKGRRRDRTGTR